MKKKDDVFVKEITDKFSELFTETFFIRYLADYDINNIIDVITKTKKELEKKVNKRFVSKLLQMGFDKKDIKL